MHELALARSLIEMVDDYAHANGARRVTRVRIRVGVLSALTRALHVSFRAASRGTSCDGAVLEIEEVPLTVYCRFCDDVKAPSGPYNFRCPVCGHATPKMVTGREMQLVSIALDESAGTDASPPGSPVRREASSGAPPLSGAPP